MFERATDDIIALAMAAAAAVVAVVAAAFALYAYFEPIVHPAWAATIVSGTALVLVGALALAAGIRARIKQHAAEEAQAELAKQLPLNIADLARDHPFAALAMSVVGGAVAARHPKLARDLLSLVTRFTNGR